MGVRLKNKIAIISGAGSIGPGWGNGKATAVLFAREGAKVFAVDINLAAAEETKEIIEKEGGDCTVHQTDVTKNNEVQTMVERCIQVFGRIDILQNNVGIAEVGGPVEISEVNWDKLMNVNLKSMFLTCKYCIPYMEKQGCGAIVNISSIGSIRYIGYPSVSYCASKGAVNQLTQNIAMQYAARGIRANCVLPGLMNTPTIQRHVKSGYADGNIEKMLETRNQQCPTKQMGDAWDVAYASLFLASDEARYITGTQLVVDGGLSCKFS